MNDAEQISHLKGFSPVTTKEKYNFKIVYYYLRYKIKFVQDLQKHSHSAPLA